MISFINDDNDEIETVYAGEHKVVFLVKSANIGLSIFISSILPQLEKVILFELFSFIHWFNNLLYGIVCFYYTSIF